MKAVWKWLLVGLLVFALVFFSALPFFVGWGWGPYGMMGPGMMGGVPMMGGFGFFGFLMMLGMWLVPLALIVAVVASIVALARGLGGTPAASGSHPCPHCGKFVQAGWVACPYCGGKL